MGKKCKINAKIDCGGAPPVDTSCDFLAAVQAANPAVVVTCVEDKGKTETMECADQDGNVFSSTTGKESALLTWVTTQCGDPVVDQSCDFLAAVQAANPSVVVTCVEDKGKTETMECADQDGNVFSSSTGKQAFLLTWVTTQCGDPVVDQSCDYLAEVQAANNGVIVNCVEDLGKQEHMECTDQDGNVLSSSTGKKKNLLTWVASCGDNGGGGGGGDPTCDSLADVQAANTNVVVTCIEDLGKKETLQCADTDGNVLSTSTGKKKNLLNWVKSDCGENGGGGGGGQATCNCESEVSDFKDITCVATNTYECTDNGGNTISFTTPKAKKCGKYVSNANCASASQKEPNKNKNNNKKKNNKKKGK